MGRSNRFLPPKELVAAVSAIAGVTLLYRAGLHVTNTTIVALTYLLSVLLTAATSTLWVAVAASGLAVVCLNFFFMQPVGTFTIADPQNWVALFVLLAVSVIASHLSASARVRAHEAVARRDELSRLFDLSRDILLTTERAEAYQHLARSVARRFDLDYAAICLPADHGWRLHAGGPQTMTLADDALQPALDAARGRLEFDARERTYGGHQVVRTAAGEAVRLVPLRVGGRAIGLLATAGRELETGALDALAGVVAIAVERVQLLEERQAAEIARRGDELKSALLASIGHDLRTPLTAIRVAASNLAAGWPSDAERLEQSEIVLSEVERLTRLFQNILEMARIDTNAVATEPEWVAPAEIVEAAVAQVRHTLRRHRLAITADEDHDVRVDPRLTSAALAHLLENAAQYSPEASTVSVHAAVDAAELRIVVCDEGPGLAAADLPHLFVRFYRGSAAREQRFGTGMGLAITRGLVAAEGGRVWGETRPAGGAQFSIVIPAASRPAVSPASEAP